MRVVLINPPSTEIREHLHEGKQYPHVGLGYLQSYLLKHNIECRIIDAKFYLYSINDVIQKTLRLKPDLIGITTRTFDFEMGIKIATLIKRKKNIPIVIGGNHATSLPYYVLNNYKCFDFLIKGEGEIPLYKLTTSNFNHFNTIENLFFRDKNNIVIHGPLTPPPENIDILGYPTYPDYHTFGKRVFIMASRGCPFNCIFCGSVMGRNVRFRSPEIVVEEMEFLYKCGKFDLLEFSDESFTLNHNYTKHILSLMKKKGLCKKIPWAVSTRVDLINEEILKRMKDCGCELIIFGAESGSNRILKEWKKGITTEQIKNAIKLCHELGLKTDVNFILGAPNENYKSLFKTLNLIVKTNPTFISVSIGSPYPGTEYNVKAGLGYGNLKIIANKFYDYNNQIGNALELKNIPRKILELFQFLCYVSLYLGNLRFYDFFKFIIKFRKEAISFIKKIVFNR